MPLQRFRLSLSALAFLVVLLVAGQSFAGLLVAPQRVVMDTKTRSTVLLLMNTDKETHSYRVHWKLTTMDEQGRYHNIPLDEKDAHAVPNMVVFSPKQLQLEGNGRQNVRVSLRLPSDLPPGEYRAHLQFEALPEEENKKTAVEEGKKEKGVGFNLHILVSTSIPVIVRTGGTTGEITIANPSLQVLPDNPVPALRLDVAHVLGSNSVYGKITVFLQKEQVGLITNVAIYPEQSKRALSVPLTATPAPGSTLRIVYEGAGEYAGKTLAEQSFTIPK